MHAYTDDLMYQYTLEIRIEGASKKGISYPQLTNEHYYSNNKIINDNNLCVTMCNFSLCLSNKL